MKKCLLVFTSLIAALALSACKQAPSPSASSPSASTNPNTESAKDAHDMPNVAPSVQIDDSKNPSDALPKDLPETHDKPDSAMPMQPKRVEYNEFKTKDKKIVGYGNCRRSQEGVVRCPVVSAIARCANDQCECVITSSTCVMPNYDDNDFECVKDNKDREKKYIKPCSPSSPDESDIQTVQYESSQIQIPEENLTVRKLCVVKDNQVSEDCECVTTNGEYDSNGLLQSSNEFVDCTNGKKLYE